MGQGSDVQGVSAVLRQLTTRYALYFPDARMSPTISSVTVTSRRHCDLAWVELKFDGAAARICVKFPKDPKKRPHTHLERVGQDPSVEFETLSYLHERFRRVPGCAVVRPIALFPEEMAVVTEVAEGNNLHDLIKRKAGPWCGGSEVEALKAHCLASGVWLRHFQEFTAQQRQAALPMSKILEQVTADLEVCVQMGLPRAVAFSLLTLCEEQLRTVEGRKVPVVGEHPDFQPDNILLSPAGVTVLDFTNFQYGSAYNDVGRFLASLDFLRKNPLYSRERIHTLKAAFLEGYGWSRNEMDAGLTAYLIRYMVQATRTARKWSYPNPVKRLLERWAIGCLSAWCRRAMRMGDACGEHILG
ncbi:MAG: phosphotransferase [Kofleriaceae bacterium]|nr:phosphotransferase [Candidatus Methylomirabilis lanthanidiphila]